MHGKILLTRETNIAILTTKLVACIMFFQLIFCSEKYSTVFTQMLEVYPENIRRTEVCVRCSVSKSQDPGIQDHGHYIRKIQTFLENQQRFGKFASIMQ